MERLIRSSSIAFGIKGSTPTSKDCEKTEQTNFHHFFYKCGSFLTAWKLLLVINIFAHYFVKQVLKLLQLLKITYQRFPYNEEIVGSWFTKQIDLPESSSGRTQLRTIHMMNINGIPSKIQKLGPITEFLSNLKQDGFKILFHGTTHSSAKDIIEKGIRLDQLKRKQDFSCGEGFYLTGKFEGKTGALLWSFNRFSHGKRQAVVIFKIPRAEIDRYKDNSKDFKENEDELKAWVKKYRFGDGTPQGDLERNLRGVSFVEGPWVEKVDDCIMPIEGSYQMCLHSEELAECFNRHLCAAIFVNKLESS